MIITGIAVLYLVSVYVIGLRRLLPRFVAYWAQRALDNLRRDCPELYREQYWRNFELRPARAISTVAGIVLSLVWPLWLAGWALVPLFRDSIPVILTREEQEDQRLALKKKIHDLELENERLRREGH